MTTVNYPEIDLVSFFGDSVEWDSRASRVEQGKNGVIDRKRVHFINATKRIYTINATLRDRDTLQSFLEQNRGTPFVFRYDGLNNPGLFIVRNFTWDWLVYFNNSGVWKLSLSLEEVFRPGWIPSIRIRSGASYVSGIDPKLRSNAFVLVNTAFGIGIGSDITLLPGQVPISIPLGITSAEGYDAEAKLGIFVNIPIGIASSDGFDPRIVLIVPISLGTSSSEGFDPNLIPNNVTESVPLGISTGDGFNPTLIPAASTVTILFGQSNVTGIDPIIIGDQLILIIPVGTSSGEGFNPTVIGELIDYSRITATGNGRVTADGSTRIISVARVTADGEDRITADGDQRIIL